MQTLPSGFDSSVDEIAAAWDPQLRSAPSLRLPAGRTIVVTRHLDDAALSSGGLIMHQMAKGMPLIVVAVSDALAAARLPPEPALAPARREHTALSILGVPAAATIRLGLATSAARGDALAERLGDIIEPADVVVAPWRDDWSRDDATAWGATQEIARARSCTLIGSLFWALNRVDPCHHPDLRIAGLDLTEEESVWRWEALQSRSRTGAQSPGLDASLVERLRLPIEYYVEAP